ncbi:MAG TPA: SRPBCC family protein [Candidatus Deferrimicrobium sp.]|nr:SRPBCC family protein [Candidatus Deferrimicrobium sp.]
MSHITASEEIAAPVESVFAFVDDHRNTTKYMKDLTKWAPVGSKSHGKGAQFQVAMKAGPLTLSSVVDITTWTENRTIGWRSIEGFKQTGKWSFKAIAGGGTEATFDMEYQLPGGIAGRMASRLADPVVRSNIEQSVRSLRSQVERAAKPKKAVKPAPARKR